MDHQKSKLESYYEILKESIHAVESVLNQLQKLEVREEIYDSHIIEKVRIRTYCDLELSLANVCIVIRKMVENQFATIDSDTRRDINSIIHSHTFVYHNRECLYVYSQKGKEEVSIQHLLSFAKKILPQ